MASGRSAMVPFRATVVAPSRPRALTPSRLGFTLIEVLVGLVLLAIVSAILFQLVISSQRVSQAQTERGALQANARAGVLILPNELQELGYSTPPGGSGVQSDIRWMGTDFIDFRAKRGIGFTCGASPSPNDRIRIRTGPTTDGRIWRGLRAPQAGDSIFIFIERDPAQTSDDRWKRARVTARSDVTCVTGGAGSAWELQLDDALNASPGAIASLDDLKPGAPVIWYERVFYDTYIDQGQTWLGLRVNGGPREPILGPLEDVTGLRFRYFNRAGNEITDSTQRPDVRTIEVGVNGASARLVRAGGGTGSAFTTDSVRFTTRVSLRNSQERP